MIAEVVLVCKGFPTDVAGEWFVLNVGFPGVEGMLEKRKVTVRHILWFRKFYLTYNLDSKIKLF